MKRFFKKIFLISLICFYFFQIEIVRAIVPYYYFPTIKNFQKQSLYIGKWINLEIPDCNWKICVDTSPLLEKAWAEEAGIGWIGKNSNLIS